MSRKIPSLKEYMKPYGEKHGKWDIRKKKVFEMLLQSGLYNDDEEAMVTTIGALAMSNLTMASIEDTLLNPLGESHPESDLERVKQPGVL